MAATESRRRIRYQVACSLDGYIASPNGESDWIIMDPAIDFGELMGQYDTLLMGRKTADGVSGGGDMFGGMKTVVVSRTLRQEDHPKVTIVSDRVEERLNELRAQPGKDIWLFGARVWRARAARHTRRPARSAAFGMTGSAQVAPALPLLLAALLSGGGAAAQTVRPDGLYAQIHTTKGRIVALLDYERTPMTVANFVGLAEGTIENAAFDAGRPFFDGTSYHRVVPGHVIQTGAPLSDRARGPGYTFPNEIHGDLSHDHAGALNMANGGPHTNSSQFCITLGDRSYLDGDYTVFGEVVEGMDVVMRIVQGDVVDSVRIVRVGAGATAFRPTTASFRAMVRAAEARVAEDAARKRDAEEQWIASSWPAAAGPIDSVRTVRLREGTAPRPAGPLRVRYHGTALRYLGHVIGRTSPHLAPTRFGSGPDGVPALVDSARTFTYQPGTDTIVPALDRILAEMLPGERRILIVPAGLAYGRGGFYGADTPGMPRFVISPNTLLVYDVEVIADARISSSVAGGSKENRGRKFR